MPVFINYSKRVVLFTSYKVGYSTILSQKDLGYQYVSNKITLNIYLYLLRLSNFKKYVLLRNPYDRFSSLFQDKFRKQPKRILEGLHSWENVHRCLYGLLNISDHESDENIAKAFLAMSPSFLLKNINEIKLKDGHFFEQAKSFSLPIFFEGIRIPLKIDGIFRIEDDLQKLAEQTGLEFNVVKNESRSYIVRDGLSAEDISIINSVYLKDFKLGGYKLL